MGSEEVGGCRGPNGVCMTQISSLNLHGQLIRTFGPLFSDFWRMGSGLNGGAGSLIDVTFTHN